MNAASRDSRRVLLVSNVFGPCRFWTSEQQRIEGFRRYLPEFGWHALSLVKRCHCLDSLTSPSGGLTVPADLPVSSAALIEHVRDCATGSPDLMRLACAARPLYRRWLSLADAAGFAFRTPDDAAEVCHLVYPLPAIAGRQDPPRRRLWLPLVKALGRLIARVHEQDRIDWVARGVRAGAAWVRAAGAEAVVGSFPSEQNIEIAAGIARRTGVPWLADFRDAVLGGYCCGRRTAERLRPLLSEASTLVYASAGCAEIDRAFHRSEPTVIENGYLEEDVARARRQVAGAHEHEKLTIRFLGTLYPMRNLDVFLEGLALLTRGRAGLESCVRFEYYGPSADAAADAVCRFGVGHLCTIQPSVPTDESLRLTADADALVLPTNTVGFTGVAGAKFYEYLACRRPILAAGGDDPYVARTLERAGAGVVCMDASGVAETLVDWLARWQREGHVAMNFDESSIAAFSRRAGAQRLAGLLGTAVSDGPSIVQSTDR